MTDLAHPRATAEPGEQWYSRSEEEMGRLLSVDPEVGLSEPKAAELLARNGPNSLPEEKPLPGWRRFADEYRSYMQLILAGAAIVSLAIGEWTTGVVLLLLTVLNAVVGLRQQGKAESAMNALKSLMKATARVRRGGGETQIPAEGIVVGDVVLIAAGDQVPADGRIIEAHALQIDESSLTGESVPVDKASAALPPGELTPGDQTNMAFMNTQVTHGSGTVLVTATGGDTVVGRISGLLRATRTEMSPLSRQLNTLSLWIVAAAGLTMVVMFATGRSRGQSWDALFVSAVSLAIAAIPEALPTVTQVILSLGGVELAQRNAIVKDLPSVETLGFTSAINSDKTGTLTMNQMTVVEVTDLSSRYRVTGTGYDLAGEVKRVAGDRSSIDECILPLVVANDSELLDGRLVGDPTESALLVVGHKAGLDVARTRERLPRLATLPFDASYKLMATFHAAVDDSGSRVVRCLVKGAAPAVLARAASVSMQGRVVPWDDEMARRAAAELDRMGRAGLRVMAAATRDLDPARFQPDGDLLAHVGDLCITALVGMVDPPRPDARAAVAAAQSAHIRVRMVTGDDVTTGEAVARQLGIKGEVILGADFSELTEPERMARIDRIGVLGRVVPEHKVLLAETLKRKGDVVAMTGDGVNDAPAIKAADIGIAMGSGTDVAKNAGRMILSDDDFATIVFAVGRGRKIYDNLTKYIRFVLLLLIAFVVSFMGAAIFNIAAGEPFTSAEVLWVHFFINAPFGFALGFDRETPGLMQRTPRPRGQSVLTRSLMVTVGLVGLFMAVSTLLMIEVGVWLWNSEKVGSSIAFTAFAFMMIVAAFECRSDTASVLTVSTFDSRQMNRAAVGEFILAVLTTQMDALRRFLGTEDLDMRQFRWALLPAIALLALWELGKLAARHRAPSVVAPQIDLRD